MVNVVITRSKPQQIHCPRVPCGKIRSVVKFKKKNRARAILTGRWYRVNPTTNIYPLSVIRRMEWTMLGAYRVIIRVDSVKALCYVSRLRDQNVEKDREGIRGASSSTRWSRTPPQLHVVGGKLRQGGENWKAPASCRWISKIHEKGINNIITCPFVIVPLTVKLRLCFSFFASSFPSTIIYCQSLWSIFLSPLPLRKSTRHVSLLWCLWHSNISAFISFIVAQNSLVTWYPLIQLL